MRWVRNYQGKYANDKDALGICDYSSFNHNHKDLKRQMEWRGDRLVWTGFLVGEKFLDQPNEQLRPPRVQADPYPVIQPRFPANFVDSDAVSALPTDKLLQQLRSYNMVTRQYEK